MNEQNICSNCGMILSTEPEIAWKKCSSCFWTDYELYKKLYGERENETK